jgi:hypothetical protein
LRTPLTKATCTGNCTETLIVRAAFLTYLVPARSIPLLPAVQKPLTCTVHGRPRCRPVDVGRLGVSRNRGPAGPVVSGSVLGGPRAS